jgi:hypothetical protein
MPPFADWLDRVLTEGESVQAGPPVISGPDAAATRDVLRRAFDRHVLDVAGPLVPFHEAAALAAAGLLAVACWRLVADEDAPPSGPNLAREPSVAAAHLSADVTLRFLPAVYRRARLRGADDPLAIELADRLRHWPLSGVLADLPRAPAISLDFGGHPGLQLLYAERLADHENPAWVPAAGPAREWAERVFAERGRPLPVAAPTEEAAA